MKGSNKRSWGLGKRAIACACSAALGVALLPAAAFAADAGTGAGGGSGQQGTGGDPVISVSIKDAKTGSEVSIKKARYTQTQLEEMAGQNKGTKSYVFMSKGAPKVVSTNEYVTLDQLLSPVGDKWAEGSTVSFSDPTGFGADTKVTYKDATTSYYYPEGTAAGPAGKAQATSTVIGLDEASGALSGESTADDIAGSFQSEDYTTESAPRVYSGITSNDATQAQYPMGRGFVSHVSKITVTYPHQDFQVIARDADTNAETPIASYSDEQLEGLAKANKKSLSYLYGSGVYTTTSYVTLDQLIGKDKRWKAGSSVEINTPDNFATTFSYEDATAKRYFYPEYVSGTPSDANAVEVPAVIGLNYKSGKLAGTSTAADVANASLENQDSEGAPRFFIGNTSANSILKGMFSPQNVCKVTIIYKAEKKPAVTPTKKPAKKVTKVTVNAKTVSAKAVKKAIGKNSKTVKTVVLGSKVKKVSKGAFAKYKKVATLELKTKKLTKKGVKGSLKSSKVKTVKVSVGSKKTNKRYVKAYKKIFTKANAGKKVSVK